MIIVLKNNIRENEITAFREYLEKKYNIGVHVSTGHDSVVLGLIGDTSAVDEDSVKAQEIVQEVKRVQEPYKKSNRKFHPDNTVITLENGLKIGDGDLTLVAGPCSVENEEQVTEVAQAVKTSGAVILRGGAFKPRTSPYAFQGMGVDGLALLKKAREKTGLPIISEVMSVSQLRLFDDVDIIQVGARNMQNFELLKELGRQRRPIMLKRGLSSTIEELLMSAEYIMSSGNEQVILCERGIRTFETKTRNTLDISAVPILKRLSHLPVFVDPSHASGIPWLVEPLSMAAVAAGADGLIIEVHNNPAKALCDGAQSLTPAMFESTVKSIRKIADAVGKRI
ncbi:MAG: 3-deoxy-7-phosphoheptulonate synthase [Eubacteriales bacterium]|nr:3-deoxy-7-phosphoheptulonate synthase [Eubacteriales bacterium]MDD4422754.1 3-deoxy-7-phosphoheptulonate synthase [Eubacteriales bacterium]